MMRGLASLQLKQPQNLVALCMICATASLGCGGDESSTGTSASIKGAPTSQPPAAMNTDANPATGPGMGATGDAPLGTTVTSPGPAEGQEGTAGADSDPGSAAGGQEGNDDEGPGGAGSEPSVAEDTRDESEPNAADHPGTPPDVARSWHEWPLPGKDYNNSRYTQDSSITSANVSELEEAWRVELPGLVIAYGLISTVPIIVDGTVYIQDLSSSVRAIDLETGAVKWADDQSNLNPGPNGVAVGWGKVFAIGGSDSVVAYDAETGDQLWVKNVVDTATAGIDIQPTVFDDQVLVSTVPISTRGIYAPGDRGILKALDQETGDEIWRYDTISSEGDVWGNSGVNSGGGSWFPPSIDVETGRVFWAVANPAPFPGTFEFPNGSSREGDNLYTDSTLAIDVLDGNYAWHHQTIQHDLFDRDLLHTMLAEVGGVPVVVSTGKEGRVWANRRDTGEVLWGPVEVGVHMNDELTELSGGRTRVLPGSFGGVLTPPALAEGVAYVATLNAPTRYSANQTAYFGSEIGTMDGNLVAIDVATGDPLWDVTVEGDPTGGVTVVNDLVITATFQGKVFAYARETGDEVWSWTAPGGINSWLSVSGNTLVIPVGSARPATVVALSLGGNAAPGANAEPVPGGEGSSAESSNAFSAVFTDILAAKCAGPLCHSGDATGGSLVIDAGADASSVRDALVNQPATGSECASVGLSMVVPGNPDMSLLYRKLTDMPPCGSRMPPTGPLTSDELGRVRKWIEDGAADD